MSTFSKLELAERLEQYCSPDGHTVTYTRPFFSNLSVKDAAGLRLPPFLPRGSVQVVGFSDYIPTLPSSKFIDPVDAIPFWEDIRTSCTQDHLLQQYAAGQRSILVYINNNGTKTQVYWHFMKVM